MSPLLALALEAATRAGRVIMEVYRSDAFDASLKEDRSPITRADRAADAAILAALKSSTIPCVTEESCPPPEQRLLWDSLWLVDPLDGTKDFIARNDEFTVNIALVRSGRPVLGVVLAPALGLTYYAEEGLGAFRRGPAGDERIANRRRGPALTAAESRFHGDPRTDAFCARHGIAERLRAGSALKFCRLAEGAVDVYPRFNGSSEWDVAAGHCIAREAGCRVVDAESGLELVYNKPSLRNPFFVASGPAFQDNRL